MKLYFIRHTSVNVPKGTCYGHTNVRVNKTFPEEADIVRNKIKEIAFDAVFTSPLSRCVQLTYHCGFESAIVDHRLKELNFGDWEMQKWDDIKDPNLQNWFDDWQNIPATNGESLGDMYRRFSEFIYELPPLAETVAIFTHGGIVNCARLYAGQTTFEKMFETVPDYGSITELDIIPGDDQSKG